MAWTHPTLDASSFEEMLEAFRKVVANWANSGFVDGEWDLDGEILRRVPGGSVYRSIMLYAHGGDHIRIEAWLRRKHTFFFSVSSVDAEKLQSYCSLNQLQGKVEKFDSDYETVNISGTKEAFQKSDLMGIINRSRERAQSLSNLAQKFYESDMMKQLWQEHDYVLRVKKPSVKCPRVHQSEFAYSSWYDEDGYSYSGAEVYNFQKYGYRELETEDEMIAFTLAMCAGYWKTEPKDLHWPSLMWNLDINRYTFMGRTNFILEKFPKYAGMNWNGKRLFSAAVPAEPGRDFF